MCNKLDEIKNYDGVPWVPTCVIITIHYQCRRRTYFDSIVATPYMRIN